MLYQQTTPQRSFVNVSMASYHDVTNSVYLVTMAIMDLRHCSILEFGREASNQAVALGITRPLDATVVTGIMPCHQWHIARLSAALSMPHIYSQKLKWTKIMFRAY